ncbi:hypothetical protein [Microvirga massiliensis]|uniref:hypothetical protein n=1 Tax=Microvirga massiliensis TaxID=1033741 RepID=UPI000660B684|nr:hypothetical protein [Microvirga massiliensis]
MALLYGDTDVGHVVSSDTRGRSSRWAAVVNGLPECKAYGPSASQAVRNLTAHAHTTGVERHVRQLRLAATAAIMLEALKAAEATLAETLGDTRGRDVSDHPALRKIRAAIHQAEEQTHG